MSTTADASTCRMRLNRSVELLLLQQSDAKSDVSGELFWSVVNGHIRRRALRRAAIAILFVIGIGVAVGNVPTLKWSAAAVGRLALIRGVLPWWDWRPLDGDLCVWEVASKAAPPRTVVEMERDHHQHGGGGNIDGNGPAEECDFCENIDKLVHLSTPPSILDFEHYVRFNQPIVIASPPSTDISWTSASVREQLLLADKRLADVAPACDLRTNVLLGRSPSLNQIVEHTLDRPSRPNDTGDANWYVAFRNCGPGATRASRPLWPRPAWMPLHLRPYANSWLIMSQMKAQQKPSGVFGKVLRVRGLAVMTQLCGTRRVRLEPPLGCAECDAAILGHRLQPGESMVFAADRWRLEYETSGDDEGVSITFVAEFDWEY